MWISLCQRFMNQLSHIEHWTLHWSSFEGRQSCSWPGRGPMLLGTSVYTVSPPHYGTSDYSWWIAQNLSVHNWHLSCFSAWGHDLAHQHSCRTNLDGVRLQTPTRLQLTWSVLTSMLPTFLLILQTATLLLLCQSPIAEKCSLGWGTVIITYHQLWYIHQTRPLLQGGSTYLPCL